MSSVLLLKMLALFLEMFLLLQLLFGRQLSHNLRYSLPGDFLVSQAPLGVPANSQRKTIISNFAGRDCADDDLQRSLAPGSDEDADIVLEATIERLVRFVLRKDLLLGVLARTPELPLHGLVLSGSRIRDHRQC